MSNATNKGLIIVTIHNISFKEKWDSFMEPPTRIKLTNDAKLTNSITTYGALFLKQSIAQIWHKAASIKHLVKSELIIYYLLPRMKLKYFASNSLENFVYFSYCICQS